MRWVVGALLLLAVGVVFQLGLLVYAMYALLGVMFVSWFLAKNWIENVDAARECSRLSADVGETVAVVTTIRNTGGLPIAWLLVEDSLPRAALAQRPPRIKVHRRRVELMMLKGNSEKTLLYQVEFQMRGYYQFGPLLVESGDLFGLHRRYRVLTEPHYILVYPKVVHVEGYDVASRRPIGEVRMTHRLFEDPTRLAGVRPYQTGDPLNRIHWRATARTGELHSRTYEPSSIAGATILLDFHTAGYDGRGEPHRSELAVTTAASLANAVYLLGQQVGLFTNGRDAADRIRTEGHRLEFRTRDAARDDARMQETSTRLEPVVVDTARGADQLVRILEALARVELTDGLTFAQLATETAGRLPRDATVVAILPAVPAETAIALGNLKRGGYAVTAVLVMYDDRDEYAESAGRLMAEGIEVRNVESEEELATLCSGRLTSDVARN